MSDNDMAGDVRAFREAMGQGCPDRPVCEGERSRDTMSTCLVIEEFQEWIAGATLHDEADALIDLIYVALGRLWAMGIDPAPLWRLVHDANMAKLTGPKSPEGKQLKPPGWTHPDIAGEIERQRKEGHG